MKKHLINISRIGWIRRHDCAIGADEHERHDGHDEANECHNNSDSHGPRHSGRSHDASGGLGAEQN